MHGFFQRKLKSDENIDAQASLCRSKNKSTTSHFVGTWMQSLTKKYEQGIYNISIKLTKTRTNK